MAIELKELIIRGSLRENSPDENKKNRASRENEKADELKNQLNILSQLIESKNER